jgi:hypothetical protein
MITYTWKIEELEWLNRASGLAKVVCMVRGRCEGTQDDHTCHLPFTADLSLPESSSYISYDDLTEEQVLTWAKTALGTPRTSDMESTIATLITEDLAEGNSVKHVSQLPWLT